MATLKWRGDSPAIAQVNSVTPANVTVGNIFSVTINGKTVSFVATAATVANVTAGLASACAAATIAEFAEISWSDATTKLTASAKSPGKPFTQTSSASQGSGSAGPTCTTATTTASSGPNDWSVAANWDSGAVPVNGDDVVIENSASDVLYGLSQSSVTLASLTIAQSYSGKIGLPVQSSLGYYEYRPTYLAISATQVSVGAGSGAGSSRIKLNTGSNQTTINVLATGTPAEPGLESLLWKGAHASNVLSVNKGSVGVAVLAGEAATLATWNAGYTNNRLGDVALRIGANVTQTSGNQTGGHVEVRSSLTTLTKTDGLLTMAQGTVGTLNIDGGNVYYTSTGTCTTVNVGEGGILDCSRDMRGRTFTNTNVYSGGSILDPFRTVTWTNGVDLERCAIADVVLDLGTHLKLTPAAPT